MQLVAGRVCLVHGGGELDGLTVWRLVLGSLRRSHWAAFSCVLCVLRGVFLDCQLGAEASQRVLLSDVLKFLLGVSIQEIPDRHEATTDPYLNLVATLDFDENFLGQLSFSNAF